MCEASTASRVVYNRGQDFFMLLRVLVCWRIAIAGRPGLNAAGLRAAERSAGHSASGPGRHRSVQCSPTRCGSACRSAIHCRAAAIPDRPAAAGNRRGVHKSRSERGHRSGHRHRRQGSLHFQPRKERLPDPGRRQAADHQLLFARAEPAGGGGLPHRPQQFQPRAVEKFPDCGHRAGADPASRQGKVLGLSDRLRQ